MFSHKSDKLKIDFRLFGEVLLIQILLCYALPVLGFFLDIPINGAYLPASLLGGILIFYKKFSTPSTLIRVLLLSLICWAAAIILTLPFTDCSYDGNWYHQEVVAALCDGWIPNNGLWDDSTLSVWARHYAKALEITEATVVAFTGVLESGKCINLIFGCSAAMIVYGFLTEFFPSSSVRKRLAVVIITLCNPVYVSQLLTFYIDFAKYFLTLLSIIFVIEILCKKNGVWAYVLLSTVIILAAGTKFNAFFEVGIVVIAAVIWSVCKGNMKIAVKLGCAALFTALVGSLIFGYHPYVTNYLYAGNPFYPLMGEGSYDIMTGNTPPEYLNHNRVYNFFYSLLTLAIPAVDTRQGGFGILMLPMLILSFYLIILNRKTTGGIPLYISIWILASCFFFEQSWWARYITQLWIILCIASATTLEDYNHIKQNKIFLSILTVCTLLTGVIGLVYSGAASLRYSLYRNAIHDSFKDKSIEVVGLKKAYEHHMREAGITGVNTESPDSTRYQVAYYGYPDQPGIFPIMQLDSADYSLLKSNVAKIPLFNYDAYFLPEKDTEKK